MRYPLAWERVGGNALCHVDGAGRGVGGRDSCPDSNEGREERGVKHPRGDTGAVEFESAFPRCHPGLLSNFTWVFLLVRVPCEPEWLAYALAPITGPWKAVGDPGAIIRTNRPIFYTDAGQIIRTLYGSQKNLGRRRVRTWVGNLVSCRLSTRTNLYFKLQGGAGPDTTVRFKDPASMPDIRGPPITRHSYPSAFNPFGRFRSGRPRVRPRQG